jgi:hypothetical protein
MLPRRGGFGGINARGRAQINVRRAARVRVVKGSSSLLINWDEGADSGLDCRRVRRVAATLLPQPTKCRRRERRVISS